MMDTTTLHAAAVDDTLSVAGQLQPHDMPALAHAGFRSVINNRPDHEGGAAQPSHAELEQAARAAGLAYRFLPVPPAGHTHAQAEAMARLVQELPGPVLAFCRTGRRSAALYMMGKSLA